jgi:hypothetical protein
MSTTVNRRILLSRRPEGDINVRRHAQHAVHPRQRQLHRTAGHRFPQCVGACPAARPRTSACAVSERGAAALPHFRRVVRDQ